MPTETFLDARPQRFLNVSGGHEVPAVQTDSLLAEATAHLLWAYEAIDQFSQSELHAVEFVDVRKHLSIALRHAGCDRPVL